MKLLSSFQLATRFYSNSASIARWHELGLWLNQDPVWKTVKTVRSLMELVYCLLST